jgi:hypothetical protein
VSGQKIFHQKNICDKGHQLVSKLHIAEVAQLVEHSPEEGRVTGSTPVLSTKYKNQFRKKLVFVFCAEEESSGGAFVRGRKAE